MEDGTVARDVRGRTFYVEPSWDPALEPEIRKWFSDFYTIQFDNYPVDMAYLPHAARVATLHRS